MLQNRNSGKKIDKFIIIEFVFFVLAFTLLTYMLHVSYTLGGLIKIVGCSVIITILNSLYENEWKVVIVLLLETVIVTSIVLIAPIPNQDDFFRYLIFSCSIVYIVNLCNGLLNYFSYSGLVKFIVTGTIFLPVVGCWIYYYKVKSFVSCDTILAILQTNMSEALEYISASFSLPEILFIVSVVIVSLLTVSFVPGNKISVRGGELVIIFLSVVIAGFSLIKYRENLLTKVLIESTKFLKVYGQFEK